MPTRSAARSAPRRAAGVLAGLAAAVLLAAAPGARANDVTVAHGISAFGELKYPADFAHFDYANPDAPKGGVWSGRGTGASNTFDSLNPFVLKGEPAQGLSATFDTLLVASADEPDSYYGLLAEEIEYPDDRAWIAFRLRPEARFADGSPVTAEDVAWSFRTLKTEGAPVYCLRLKDVESATVLGEHEVRFDFADGVSARDLPSLVGSLPVLSEAWWQGRDFSDSTLDPILGSGPYDVGEVQPGRSIEYLRREDYWGADLPVNRGTNNFDRYVFEYFKDYTAAFEGFKGGAFLFHEEFFSKIWATGYDFPAVENGWVIREQIPDARPSGIQGFWFNLRRPQFADPDVRQALAMAFDFEWSNDTLFYGLYTRTDSFFENSPMEAEGLPSEAELALLEPLRGEIPESVFTEPAYSPPETDGSGSDRGVLRRASRLLSGAGWEVGDDGLRRNAEGETLRVEFLLSSPTFQRIIGPYVENLKRLGVDASQRVVDPAQYQARQEEFDYDVITGRFVMSLTPGPNLRNLFGSQSADQPGTPNLAGVSDPAVDALIEHVVDAESREALDVAARALDRVLRAKHIWTPNWYKASYNVAYWDLFGRPETAPKYARGDGFWWWDAEKAAALEAEGAP